MTFKCLSSIIISIAVIGLNVSCYRSRKPDVFLMPDGYVGWVKIEYGSSTGSVLPVVNKAYELPIPASGHLQTSNEMESGFAADHYFYVDKAGNRKELQLADQIDSSVGMIRATHYFTIPEMTGQKARTFHVFFVGSAEDYSHAKKDQKYLLSM